METAPKFDITRADLNQDILRRVEKTISDLMVDALFPDALCSSNVTARFLLQLNSQHQGLESNETAAEIVGLAADPPDRVLDGAIGGMYLITLFVVPWTKLLTQFTFFRGLSIPVDGKGQE